MKTRSQQAKENTQVVSHYKNETKREIENIILYMVELDFDEASASWKANKKSIGNGQYKYICLKTTKSGNSCKRESIAGCDYCKQHSNNNP
jgi:hypothetical protein